MQKNIAQIRVHKRRSIHYPNFGHSKRRILYGEISDRTKLIIISGWS